MLLIVSRQCSRESLSLGSGSNMDCTNLVSLPGSLSQEEAYLQ